MFKIIAQSTFFERKSIVFNLNSLTEVKSVMINGKLLSYDFIDSLCLCTCHVTI